MSDDEATSVHVNITGSEGVRFHRALEKAIGTGEIDTVELRNLLAELRNALAADGIDVEYTILQSL